MSNKLFIVLAVAVLTFGTITYAAPITTYQVNLLPQANQTYDLGTTTPAREWKNVYTKNLFISGTCTGCGGGGASTTLLADTNTWSGFNTFNNLITGSISGNAGTVTNGVYTTTFGGLFDNRLSASSSVSGITTLPNLSIVKAQVSDFGTYENPLTFSPPLFRNTNTISWYGLSTTTQPASSNLLASNGTNGVYGAATTSPTFGLGLTGGGTWNVLGSAPTLSVATSSLYSGTVGQVPYFSGTNTITATSSIVIDTNRNVGIGTTTPWGDFSINLPATTDEFDIGLASNQWAKIKNNGAAGSFRFETSLAQVHQVNAASSTSSGVLFTNQYAQTADFLSTDGTNPSYVGALGGNVGVGTTTPWAKLSVNPTGTTGPSFIVGSSTATGLIVNNNNHVGIGTTTTAFDLTIDTGAQAGGILINSQNNPVLQYNVSGVSKGLLALATTPSGPVKANDFVFRADDGTNGNILFGTQAGAVVPLYLARGGNVGVGSTSPATLLEVGGSTANITFDGYKNCTGFTSSAIGKLACTVSDSRLKRDVVTLEGALATINTLRPVSFYFNDGRSERQQFGLIAQEVEKVYPNLVTKTNPTPETPDGTYTVDYPGLIAPMIKAIQELSAKVDEQQKQLKEQQEEIDRLQKGL